MNRMKHRNGGFRVIEGGRDRAANLTDQAILGHPCPQPSAAELAADMAEIYANTLLRDIPFDAVGDPHFVVKVDAGTRFTLHELLCELRSLTWFDHRAVPASDTEVAVISRAGQGDAGHRRALRWNDDGQLTLRTLFRGGVASDGTVGPGLLAAADHGAPPQEAAGLSAGAIRPGRPPGDGLPGSRPRPRTHVAPTPRALAAAVQTSRPGHAFFAAALRAVDAGTPLDRGLRDARFGPARPWVTGLLAEALRRATTLAQLRATRPERPSRPATTAARFSVLQARDDLETGPKGQGLRAALDELMLACPNLLHWIGRSNAVARAGAQCHEVLLLPGALGASLPVAGGDSAAQVLVAGALATLLKAVLALPETCLSEPAPRGFGVSMQMLNRMAGDVALGRVIAGAQYHCEAHTDLRLGEALGLQVLREVLAQANRTASVRLVDFDGARLDIAANPQAFGHGSVTLRRAASYAEWPAEARRRAAHLTAVV